MLTPPSVCSSRRPLASVVRGNARDAALRERRGEGRPGATARTSPKSTPGRSRSAATSLARYGGIVTIGAPTLLSVWLTGRIHPVASA